MQAWEGVEFESSTATTPQFNSFARDYKATLKGLLLGNLELVSFNKGHFYVSGFVLNKDNGKYAYFSIPDVRFFPNEWNSNILVRTAEHDKDYTGGANNFCKLSQFDDYMEELTA